jgi:outer membrane biosynthesis protein TonB
MSNLVLEYVRPTLPWDPLPGESSRFRWLMIIFLLLALMIWVIVPRIEIPKPDRAKAEAVPENLAKVVMKRKEVPPPPPPVAKKEEVKKEEVVKKEEAAPKPVDESAPKPVVSDLQKSAAKARASQAIQEAGFDDLADLRDMNVGAVGTPTGMPGQVGSGTGGLITNTQEAGTSRSLITSRAGSGSGAGVYTGPVSSGGGGGKAGGKGTAGLIGAGAAGGGKLQSVQSNISANAVAAGGDVKVGKDGKSRRTQENVRKGFDRYSGRVNNLYQRALRDDPTMQGTITLKLSILPDGSVSEAAIGSSQLNNPDLEAKVLALVKGFNFGAENVETWSGSYTLNFYSN